MTHLSAQEAKEKDIEQLGDEFGSLFYNIKNDLYWLRLQWRIYVALFGANEDRVDLLNRASGRVAFTIEKALFESELMGICRLTDPASALRGKAKNISISRALDFVEAHPQADDLKRLIETADHSTIFARSWRDKKLAHSDDDVREGRAKVDDASNAMVAEALDSIANVVRWIGSEILDTDIMTHPVTEFSNDEVQFLEAVYLGVGAREARRNSIIELAKAGKCDEAKTLNSALPAWLTFRPDDIFDR